MAQKPGTSYQDAVTELGVAAAKSSGSLASLGKIAGSGLLKLGKGLVSIGANAALMTGLAFAVSQVISTIASGIGYVSSFHNAVADAGTKIKDTEKDLNSYKERIAEIHTKLSDQNISLSESKELREQLIGIQDQLIEKYRDEAGAIDAITQAIDGEAGALDKISQRKYEEVISAGREQYNKEGLSRFFNGVWGAVTGKPITYSNDYEQQVRNNIERHHIRSAHLTDYAMGSPELQELLGEAFDKRGITVDLKTKQFVGNVNSIIEGLDVLIDGIEDLSIGEGKKETLSKELKDARAEAVNTRTSDSELYDLIMQYSVIPSNEKLQQVNDDLKEAIQRYEKAKISGDDDAQRAALIDYNAIIESLDTLDAPVRDYFKNKFPAIAVAASRTGFEERLKTEADWITRQFAGFVNERMSSTDIMLHQGTGDWIDQFISGLAKDNGMTYEGVVGSAVNAGVLNTDEFTQLQKVIDDLGIDTDAVMSQIDVNALKTQTNLVKRFEKAYAETSGNFGKLEDAAAAALKFIAKNGEEAGKDLSKDLNGDVIAAFTSDLSKLGDVFDSKGAVKWTTVLGQGFEDAFGDIRDASGKATNSLAEFKKVLATTSDSGEIHKAFDQLATDYVYNSSLIKNLTEENRRYVEGALTEGGVVNAAEVVSSALAQKQAQLQYESLEADAARQANINLADADAVLNDATLATINALIEEKGVTEQGKEALAKLVVQKMLVNGTTINTAADNANLIALAEQAGITANALYDLLAAKNAVGSLSSGPFGNSALAGAASKVNDAKGKFSSVVDEGARRREAAKLNDRATVRYGGGNASGGGGGGGGGNKEPSKTDKEFDYVNRYLQILQEQNEELRENIDNQYVILQDAESNVTDFQSALSHLGDVQHELDALGIDYKSEGFQNLVNQISLDDAADKLDDNVVRIEEASAEMVDSVQTTLTELTDHESRVGELFDDTPGFVQPIGHGDRVGEFFGEQVDGYSDLESAARKYKSAVDAVNKAQDQTSKTLNENGKGQLTFLKQLQESDQQLIDAYKHAADSYSAEWEDYKKKILDAFSEDGKGEKYIQDIMFGNLDPEEWERLITYDSNNQTEKDKVELLERGQTAYDHQKESLKSMREWQQKLNEDIQKEFEMRLNIIKVEGEIIQSYLDEAQFNLDMKETLGEVVQEADYREMIGYSEQLVDNYRQQMAVLKEQAGTLDEGEQAWYDVQSQIRDCESAIRDCIKQQAEWNDTILRMPVENISRFLQLVQNLGSTLKNWLSINDAKGIVQSADQIQTSWTTAYDQITDSELGLMTQLEDYMDLLDNYDLGSTKFSEVSDEMQGARDQMEGLVEELIDFNRQLLTIPIDKLSELTEYLEKTMGDLQAIQSDQETAINAVINLIQKEQEKLQKTYDDLEESINNQIKPLEEMLNTLSKENDQRSRALALEQAMYALQDARNQKTVQVINGLSIQ